MMTYSPRHARRFKPRYYELAEDGTLTPTALMYLFEETAFSHCEETPWNVFTLYEAGFGWVLLEGGFDVLRYPRYGEMFTIETWMCASKFFYGTRGYEIKDASGSVIGSAQSLWLFYDLAKRKPAPIFKDIIAAWKPDPNAKPERQKNIETDTTLSERNAAKSFNVQSIDIDTNGHVHNVRYLEWALEALEPSIRNAYQLRSIRGSFMKEITEDYSVRPEAVCTHTEGSCKNYALSIHASKETDSWAAARALSSWEKKTISVDH